MYNIKLIWNDPTKEEEIISVNSVVMVRSGANNSIILSVIEGTEQIEYYCDEVFFND